MKTEKEIKGWIEKVEKDYAHVLDGGYSDIQCNAPRALMQLEATTILGVLHGVLGKPWKDPLRGKGVS